MLVDKTNLMAFPYALESTWSLKNGLRIADAPNMTGNRKLFSTYKAYNGGNVIFGSNLHGNIIGKETYLRFKALTLFLHHDEEDKSIVDCHALKSTKD
ncbi:hypothetical protein Tco_1107182 [Tanacetum coccineum]